MDRCVEEAQSSQPEPMYPSLKSLSQIAPIQHPPPQEGCVSRAIVLESHYAVLQDAGVPPHICMWMQYQGLKLEDARRIITESTDQHFSLTFSWSAAAALNHGMKINAALAVAKKKKKKRRRKAIKN